jgi:maltose alpha-D-glucosyltransferase/alpha-amylase
MQLYQRGIRRRLAPMFSGDERRLKMAHSLMFALPGTPVIWYGEEIGMGDDLSLPERNSVRTPMQWSDDANAGFSTAPRGKLIRRVVKNGGFDYRRVNVAVQRDASGSLMEHVQRLIRTRRACPEIGWSEGEVLDTGESSVVALRHDWRNETIVTLHNLADRPVEVRPRLEGVCRLRPLFCDDDDRETRDGQAPLALNPYGFRWFRAHGERR